MASNQNSKELQVVTYKCEKCDVKPFTQKSHLSTHIKLKHCDESGNRECIRCKRNFAQINNFVVHYKKEHLKRKCGQCIGKDLCKICHLDLQEAKVEWQLKPFLSAKQITTGAHICQVCKMSFGQKSHMNAHHRLKHTESTQRVCTECNVHFAQMNNFVVHFKKNHLLKDCARCNDQKFCDPCKAIVARAKKLWRSDKKPFAPVCESVEESLDKIFADVVSKANDLMTTITSELKSESKNDPERSDNLISILSDSPNYRNEEPKPAESSQADDSMKPITSEMKSESESDPERSEKRISIFTAPPIHRNEEPKPAESSQAATATVYDEILKKVEFTQTLSELAYIESQANSKHLLRANVDLVVRESTKSKLDTKFIKTVKDIDKYWILVTYLRNNPHFESTEFAKICKEVGVEGKTLQEMLQYKISCKGALGMYPRAYFQCKQEYQTRGTNTEVSFYFLKYPQEG